MIRINLLGDEKSVDLGGLYFLGGFFASVLLLLGTFFVLHQAVVKDIGDNSAEVARLEAALVDLQKITKEVKDLEKKRAELREKITIIAKLKRNKIGPVYVMDDLNMSLPERAWLVGGREKGGLFRIDGFALDNQTIAVFMKDLERSDYYETVDLVETKQSQRKGVGIKQFTLQAKVSYAGKIATKLETPEQDERRG
jgi:type IV pilus assembly protein PilN